MRIIRQSMPNDVVVGYADERVGNDAKTKKQKKHARVSGVSL